MPDIGLGGAVGFWALATLSVGAALGVVLLSNVFRAALALVLCFVGIAGLYVTLNADFLAAVQILIYAGAIAVLLIFAVMLTRDTQRGSLWNRYRVAALLIAGLFLGTVLAIVLGTDWGTARLLSDAPTTGGIANALFDKDAGFVLPFEVASVLLLAAVLGAIALLREG
ncbi:MAG: NADH-quinone oxidoreductase subunit J [Chloroflexi bacterium]|nr:NADH-quinone oxidoreductase subunit J [Chloroflexota bacterium]